MKAIAEFEVAEEAPEASPLTSDLSNTIGYTRDSVIRIEEGIIGFSQCKEFVLMEKPEIEPFRMLKCLDNPEISFVVLNPILLVPNYYDIVPVREWESIGVTNPTHRLAFAITIIGRGKERSSANLQAPLLLNYDQMTARQVILTDSGFSFRHPLNGK